MKKQEIITKDQQSLVQRLSDECGRSLSPEEEINLQNDALLLARFAIDKIADLERRVIILEKKN